MNDAGVLGWVGKVQSWNVAALPAEPGVGDERNVALQSARGAGRPFNLHVPAIIRPVIPVVAAVVDAGKGAREGRGQRVIVRGGAYGWAQHTGALRGQTART